MNADETVKYAGSYVTYKSIASYSAVNPSLINAVK